MVNQEWVKDGTAKIWSIPDGREIQTLIGHKKRKSVNLVTFSPNGQLLATASEDKTIKIWNLEGKPIKTLRINKEKDEIVSFSPDNKMVATGGRDDIIRFWNLEAKNYNHHIIDDYGTISMNFSDDGQTINLLNKDGTIRYWSLGDNKTSIKSNNYCKLFTSNILNISHNNEYLIASSSEHLAGELVLSHGNCSPTDISFQHNDSITHAVFSHDDELLATISKDRVVKLWNIDHKKPIFKMTSGDIQPKIRFSFDTQIVALGNDNNTIKLQKRDGTLISNILGDSSILSFSHDNQTLVTSSPDDLLKLWKFDSKKEITLNGSSNHITSIDFSPDGKLIAAASGGSFIALWHSDGTQPKILRTNNQKVTSIIFSHNSHILATISDNLVTLYKSNGTRIMISPRHTEEVTDIIFSHNSQMLATIGDNNLINLYKSDGSPTMWFIYVKTTVNPPLLVAKPSLHHQRSRSDIEI